jgi:hypothetical protein
MKVDLRGFRYAAQPLLARRRWELEACIAELGALTTQVEGARALRDDLDTRLAADARASAGAHATGIERGLRAHSLNWLARLHGRLAVATAALRALEAQRDEALERVREARAQVEALEDHHDASLRAFALGEAARCAAEADREWSARQASFAGGSQP